MFERFTDRARRAVVLAQEEAATLHHRAILPEHLLLGLFPGEGVASIALGRVGVTADAVRDRFTAGHPAGGGDRVARVPFSREAKRTLELALREALRLGHNYIGTEHVLLGLLRLDDAGVRAVLGADPQIVRTSVIAVMAESQAGSPGAAWSPAVVAVMDRGRQAAGPAALTTGHLLQAVLADAASQAARALASLGVTAADVDAALVTVPLADTTDAPPTAGPLIVRIGDVSTVISDPELRAAVAGLTPEEVADALRRALGTDQGPAASGS